VRGVVISVHNLGATVRLADGRLAAIPLGDVQKQRSLLTASLRRHEPLEFDLTGSRGRHVVARLPGPERTPEAAAPAPEPRETAARALQESPPAPVPLLNEPPRFEAAMAAYLRSLEEREGAGEPSPADRHALRKKKRAAWFEARRGPA
jgi:hypothetical protein